VGRNPARATVTSRRTAASEGQVSGRFHRVQAVARELIDRHVVSNVAGLGARSEQDFDHGVQLPPRRGEVLVSMQNRPGFAVALGAGLVGDQRASVPEPGRQPSPSCWTPAARFTELISAQLAADAGVHDYNHTPTAPGPGHELQGRAD
jgi:hypothetical protein